MGAGPVHILPTSVFVVEVSLPQKSSPATPSPYKHIPKTQLWMSQSAQETGLGRGLAVKHHFIN